MPCFIIKLIIHELIRGINKIMNEVNTWLQLFIFDLFHLNIESLYWIIHYINQNAINQIEISFCFNKWNNVIVMFQHINTCKREFNWFLSKFLTKHHSEKSINLLSVSLQLTLFNNDFVSDLVFEAIELIINHCDSTAISSSIILSINLTK